ncbi:MAG: N-acetyltransferase [Proteobacteria bacterium]|nr:N-acetyltransferase [Pseudomonadota bacterium]
MDITLRKATAEDLEAMVRLLPRLADFDVPPERNPEHLWIHDELLLRRWADGQADQCVVHVACVDTHVVGLTLVSMRPELLSHEPSAHLEAIAIDERVEGHGVGKRLLENAEKAAQKRGAQSLTLHVFARNTRARRLYDGNGYHGELHRYIKFF